MDITVIKKKKETSISLLKRFNKKLQQSGNLLRFKSLRFRKRNKSTLKKKKEALTRTKRQETFKKLYKLGKINILSKRE